MEAFRQSERQYKVERSLVSSGKWVVKDEEGYRPPVEYIRVTVERFTVHLVRSSAAAVSEARPNGAEWPIVEVPEEWEPVVVALAMEVLRLREGWEHPSTAKAPMLTEADVFDGREG